MSGPFHNLGALVPPGADRAKTALIDLSGAEPRHVSFGELDTLADAAARGLLRRGLSRGDRVGLLAANSTEDLAAFHGAQRAGLVPVPLSPPIGMGSLDPWLATVTDVVCRTDAALLVTVMR